MAYEAFLGITKKKLRRVVCSTIDLLPSQALLGLEKNFGGTSFKRLHLFARCEESEILAPGLNPDYDVVFVHDLSRYSD